MPYVYDNDKYSNWIMPYMVMIIYNTFCKVRDKSLVYVQYQTFASVNIQIYLL